MWVCGRKGGREGRKEEGGKKKRKEAKLTMCVCWGGGRVATVPTAANWAVGTFCGTAVVVYEACGLRRFKERAGMQRAVEIMERQKREGQGGRVGRARAGPGVAGETVGGIQKSGNEKVKDGEGLIMSHPHQLGDTEEGGKGKGKGAVVETTVPVLVVVEGKKEGEVGRSWYKFW